jgi:ribonucleoside-diphosphate reductase alpha chain
MMRRLDPEVQALIAEHGLRNALLTSIAPTGTISSTRATSRAGSSRSSPTPTPARCSSPTAPAREEEVVDYAVQMWRDLNGDADLPEHFVTAQDLAPLEHVRMQAAAQPWVDSSISKTINVPADIDFEAFKDVYLEAYETGCKGCTTYRPNDVTGSVLSVGDKTADASANTISDRITRRLSEMGEKVAFLANNLPEFDKKGLYKIASGETPNPEADKVSAIARLLGVSADWLLGLDAGQPDAPDGTAGQPPTAPPGGGFQPDARGRALPSEHQSDIIYMSEPLDRPQSLEGHTYKLKWPDSDHALYITINDVMLHGHRRPFEIFINSKNMEHYAWIVALTRMISAVFRRGGDVSFVVEELKAVFDPRGGAWMNGKYVPSILAAIGGVIERHLISIGFIDGEGMGLKNDPQAEVVNLGRPAGPACPACGQYEMRMLEGCLTCANCGHSKCG